MAIWEDCKDNFDCDIVAVALTDCLWHVSALDKQTAEVLFHRNCEYRIQCYLTDLGASTRFVKTYLQSVQKILQQLKRSPLSTELWDITPPKVLLSKGKCFWYVSNKIVYGAVVLEHQAEYYLIALTEALPERPSDPGELLNAVMYTLAWFSNVTILPTKRMHFIPDVVVDQSFCNKYGLQITEKSVHITNYGQSVTWRHAFRAYSIRNTTIGAVVGKDTL